MYIRPYEYYYYCTVVPVRIMVRRLLSKGNVLRFPEKQKQDEVCVATEEGPNLIHLIRCRRFPL